MLTIFRDRARGMEISPPPELLPELLDAAIWIDALNPTAEENSRIGSDSSLRPRNASTSAVDGSSQCASSAINTTGAASAISARRFSTARAMR